MKRGLVIFLVIIINFLFIYFVSAATIKVPGDFLTIQEAINSANFSDIIEVNGSLSPYNENLIINKSISIIGLNQIVINGIHTITSSNVKIENINFTTSGTTLSLDSSSNFIDNIIINNVNFDLTNSPAVGIHLGGGNPAFKVSNINISNSLFFGPSDKICNPWKIGGQFGSPLSVEIEDVDFSNNVVYRCSIPINLHNKNISDILIDNNVFIETDGVVYVWDDAGTNPIGVLSNFAFTNNDVGRTNSYGVGIDLNGINEFTDANFGVGNRINHNNFVGIPGAYGFQAVSLLSTLTNYTLNATFNWWGSCDGPSGAGNGSGDGVSTNVLFDPFIGICIKNKTETACAFENKDVNLFANVIGYGLDEVLFSYTTNGVNKNKTGSLVPGTLNNYRYTINSSELNNGNVSWNIYANDSFGNWFNNSVHTFYVRNKTALFVNKSNPDGLNGWYVSEPLFVLLGDSTRLRNYYEWDSSGAILYNGGFGLDGIPNPPKESAGILRLKYWSEFVCGNEAIQNQTFKVDLTAPRIKNLIPANNSIVFNEPRPTIQAYLDEVYQSNSGINKNSIVMKVDDVLADTNIFDEGSLDAIVRHNPLTDLNEGTHNVSVHVEDNSGWSSDLTWFFMINLSVSDFNLTINSPINGSFGSKRVPFNVSTTKIVSSVEFINNNDKTPRWRILCRNCDEYGEMRAKFINLDENFNNITIKAVDKFGNTEQEDISLFIDSKAPIISKTFPSRGSVTNGSSFYIKYSENNLNGVSVSWNPTIVLSECNVSGSNQVCFVDLNLSDFDGEFIDFSFNVSDFIRSVESKRKRVKVDTTLPVLTINLPKNKTGVESYGRKVPFNISISEKATIEFWDDSTFNPRWKKLCVRCSEFGMSKEKTITLKPGIHDIFIRAVDKAGNSDSEEVRFEVA